MKATTTLKEKMMNILKMISAVLLTICVTACVSQDSYYNAGEYRKPVAPTSYDVTPQVIYRIDDHRYVSIENYDHCNGQNYYIDTKAGIRTEIMRGNLSQYQGRLSIADPTGLNIVIPEAPGGTCGDKGCNAYLGYSTDGGRTFKYKKYMQSGSPHIDSVNYSILVAKDGFYLVKKISQTNGSTSVTKYPLVPSIDLEKPYPPDLHDEYLSEKPLPLLRTPSGQDRFTCDSSIHPSNLPPAK
ncbi:hypothetical protein hmeg3_24135 [Herbaspirillum sp. meg3]|uniref:T6SS immunity protein Tli3 family protein n=1 Tax=Herbaspirillum sp. meg3 TaxID=2025949 RepID=UPI000B9899AB|nr:hypothetical protein [Herbaspirillum sp. meg3]ASU41085.1 hypothetical protein hmeg3_24135 [Herbaspirillum sp. meg3]